MMTILRLLLLPLLALIPLTACNLSASAGTSTESLQVIITATSQTRSDDDVTDEADTQADSTTLLEADSASDGTSNQVVFTDTSVSQNDDDDDLIYIRGSRPANQCAVQATVNTNIRTAANLSASRFGQLVGGEWVPVSRLVNGWYQIDLTTSPVHQMWISSEPTTLDSSCRCDGNGCARTQVIPTPIVTDNWYYVGSPMPAPTSGCYVYTAGDFNVNIRTAQSDTSKILGQLRANQWISVRHLTNGWFGIIAPNTPVDGAYVANGPTQLSPSCVCTDLSCTIRTNPTHCELSTHANTVTKIHTEPSNWSPSVGELKSNQVYLAVARSSSGWYQLQDGGWVPSNYLRLSSDSCHNLRVITYDAPIFDCELVNTTDEIVTIWREPDGEYFGRFWSQHRLGVISREGKWVQVYVAAFENAGWVDMTDMVLSGECSKFQ